MANPDVAEGMALAAWGIAFGLVQMFAHKEALSQDDLKILFDGALVSLEQDPDANERSVQLARRLLETSFRAIEGAVQRR